MDFLKARMLEDFFGDTGRSPPPYLQIEGKTQNSYNLATATVIGDMKGKMNVYFDRSLIVTYEASGTMYPYETDVTWRIVRVEIPSFEYIIYGDDDNIRTINETVIAEVIDDEVYREISGFEIEVFANDEDDEMWEFRVVDVY